MDESLLPFASLGQARRLGGNQPLSLVGADRLWLVESGHLEVFAVEQAEGQPAGLRSHLFRVGAGEFVWGLSGEDRGPVGLQAVGIAEVRELSLAAVRAEPAAAGRLPAALSVWLRALGQSLLGGGPARAGDVELNPGQEFALGGGVGATVAGEPVWVRLLTGAVCLNGERQLLTLKPGKWFPLPPGGWLRAIPPSTGQVRHLEEILAAGEGLAELAEFHRIVLRLARKLLERKRLVERVRGQVRERGNLKLFGQALAGFAAGTSGEEQGVETIGLDPLLVACRLVGNSQGLEVRRPTDPDKGYAQSCNLADIAAASGFRAREVRLRGKWWTEDHGPLLARLDESRHPVALLPAGPGGYVLLDPAEQSELPVDEDLAVLLMPQAHQFYRPLPFRPVRGRDLLRFSLAGEWRDLLTLFWSGLAAGLLGLGLPLGLGLLVNLFIPAAEIAQLGQLCLGLLIATGAAEAFRFGQGVAALRLQGRAGGRLQAALWDRLLGLPVSFFSRFSAGELTERALVVDQLTRQLSGNTLALTLTAAFSTVNLLLLFYYSASLAGLAMALVGAMLVFVGGLTLLRVRLERRAAAGRCQLGGLVLQFITGVAKLRVAGAEMRAFHAWAERFAAWRQVNLRAGGYDSLQTAGLQIMPLLASLVFYLALYTTALRDGLSLGGFLAFSAAFGQFLGACLALIGILTPVLMIAPLAAQAQPILETVPEYDPADQRAVSELKGGLEVSRVSYRYQPDAPLVLRDVSLKLRPGEFVAVVGPSGSGKSTLLRLLLGFDQPCGGAILYDGQPLSSLDVRSVRRQLGVVLQNGQVLAGDLYSNISGSRSLSREEAWEAARAAGLEAEIKSLPLQLSTLVPQGGGTLSGGQRQRLLIARALATRPRLIFFDEATSALDNRTQEEIQTSLESLRATRLVIAHRLSTVRRADRIIVLDEGKVVQCGTYDELVAHDGVFWRLASRQMV